MEKEPNSELKIKTMDELYRAFDKYDCITLEELDEIMWYTYGVLVKVDKNILPQAKEIIYDNPRYEDFEH